MNQTVEALLRAVPRQSFRERSKWESAPGAPGGGLAVDNANAVRCEPIENTVDRRRTRSKRTMGTVVPQRVREKVGIDIQCFSLQLMEVPEEPV